MKSHAESTDEYIGLIGAVYILSLVGCIITTIVSYMLYKSFTGVVGEIFGFAFIAVSVSIGIVVALQYITGQFS